MTDLIARRRFMMAMGCASSSILAGCATHQGADLENDGFDLNGLLQTPPENDPWTPLLWPGKKNAPFKQTHYRGRAAMQVTANGSMSILRKSFAQAIKAPGILRFSWAIDRVFQAADLQRAETDDSPVRIALSFAGDRRKLSQRTRMQSELSRALLGEEIPYATLNYVWCNRLPVGTMLVNPRTDRIRKLVVESGPARLHEWCEYQRDVRADFLAAFDEEPGPCTGIALMTDADNTGERVNAWYGALRLSRA